MERMHPTLVVEALAPLDARRTSIRWVDHDFEVNGDSHVAHGGSSTGPDGFDLIAAALGQCLLNTLLAQAQRDGTQIHAARAMVSTKARLRRQDVAPYLSDFKVDIYIEGDLDEAARADLQEATQRLCGVRETLLQTPRIEEQVHLGPAP
jgi:uncharacterized OsmC-like protein